MDLERFKQAQGQPFGGFDGALAELRSGRKTGHWIWYIFPQLAGLGMSEMSRAYGIAGVSEAMEYLREPVLRDRLLTVSTTVLDQLRAGVPIAGLMGSSIDVTKLVSSMTLFEAVAKKLHASDANSDYLTLSDVAGEILTIAEASGYPPCERTRTNVA